MFYVSESIVHAELHRHSIAKPRGAEMVWKNTADRVPRHQHFELNSTATHRIAVQQVESRSEGVSTHRSVTFLSLFDRLTSDIFWSARIDREFGLEHTDPDILMSFSLSPFIHITSFPTSDI